MCGEALKSKLAFRGDAAHEIYTKIFAGNAAFYDPGNGGAPRTIRQAAGAGFYPSPDADLRNGHIPAADHERKQHREGAHRTVPCVGEKDAAGNHYSIMVPSYFRLD